MDVVLVSFVWEIVWMDAKGEGFKEVKIGLDGDSSWIFKVVSSFSWKITLGKSENACLTNSFLLLSIVRAIFLLLSLCYND